MKIDRLFILKLLPLNETIEEGLRVLVQKWEKIHPGTVEVIYKMTLAKSRGDVYLRSLGVFLALLLICILGVYFSPSNPNKATGLGFVILLMAIGMSTICIFWNPNPTTPLSIQKNKQVAGLQELFDTLEVISKSTNSENTLYFTFQSLKDVCEGYLRTIALQVKEREGFLKDAPDDTTLLEKTHELRVEVSNLHKKFAPLGLVKNDLGFYYRYESTS
jgi:K+ transporter